jgi:hypothetical protein
MRFYSDILSLLQVISDAAREYLMEGRAPLGEDAAQLAQRREGPCSRYRLRSVGSTSQRPLLRAFFELPFSTNAAGSLCLPLFLLLLQLPLHTL